MVMAFAPLLTRDGQSFPGGTTIPLRKWRAVRRSAETAKYLVHLAAGCSSSKTVEGPSFDLLHGLDHRGPRHPSDGAAEADPPDAQVHKFRQTKTRTRHHDVDRLGSNRTNHRSDVGLLPNSRRIQTIGTSLGKRNKLVDSGGNGGRVLEQPFCPANQNHILSRMVDRLTRCSDTLDAETGVKKSL